MADDMNDPAGTGEFAIGFGDGGPSEQLAEIEVGLIDYFDQTNRAYSGAVNSILEPIDQQIRECEIATGNALGCVTGSVDRRIDQVSEIINNLRIRVDRGIDTRMESIAASVQGLLEEMPPPPGVDIFGTSTAPTVDQCRLTPNLPGCYGPPDTAEPPALPTDLTIDSPGGGACSTSGGFPITGKTLPVGQPGPPGWVIYSYFDNQCNTIFEPGNAKWVNWGPNESLDCGITFAKPAGCGGSDTTTGGGDGGAGNDTGCIRLCQPVCGPIPPAPGGGGNETPPQNPFDDAGGGGTYNGCEFTADSVTINPPEQLPDQSEVQTQSVAADQVDNVPQIQFNVDQGGAESQVCNIPQAPDVDFTFIISCGPDNWRAAELAYAQSSGIGDVDPLTVFGDIRQTLYQSYNPNPNDGWLSKALSWTFINIAAIFISISGLVVPIIIRILPMPKSCKNSQFVNAFNMSSILSIINHFTDAVPEQSAKPVQQMMNYTCQTGIPSTTELTAQRLAGVLNRDEWIYGAKLNGDCPDWFQRSYEGGLAVPTIAQAFGLWRAGLIDETQFRRWLERNRIPQDAQIWEWKKLTEAIPGPGDLMRFMTRDTADQAAVDAGQLDQDFDKKWNGIVQEWGQRQGLTDEIALNFWRAHWNYPAPGQLFSMFHRLRPELGLIGNDGQPLSFDQQQLTTALKINDLAPAFVQRMIAISRPTIAISYLRLLYQTGLLTEDDMVPRFQDLGFDPDNARIMAKGFARSMTQQRARYLQKYEPAVARKDFIQFGLSEEKYRLVLLDAGYSGDDVENAIFSAKLEQQAKTNIRLQRQARLAYFKGRLSDQEYNSVLTDMGLEQDIRSTILVRDQRERQWKYRELSIAQMCKLVSRGYLPVDEYVRRAINLGFQQTDAAIMAANCVQEIAETRAKTIQAEIRQAIQQSARIDRQNKAKAKALCRAERAAAKCAANPTAACAIDTAPPPCELVGI